MNAHMMMDQTKSSENRKERLTVRWIMSASLSICQSTEVLVPEPEHLSICLSVVTICNVRVQSSVVRVDLLVEPVTVISKKYRSRFSITAGYAVVVSNSTIVPRTFS